MGEKEATTEVITSLVNSVADKGLNAAVLERALCSYSGIKG
ncbi:unnamed protein product, partial [Rotaria sordida]